MDADVEARFKTIEEALASIKDRLLVIETKLDGLPTVWTLAGLILPLYGLVILAFIGIVYFVLSKT